MSRAAVYDALLADQRLIDLGFDSDSVLINYDGEQRPTDEMFIVLAWQNEDPGLQGDDTFRRNFRNFTIWMHVYREFSTDYGRVDSTLDIIDDIFENMIHVPGADGQTVTLVEVPPGNRSRDMRDDAYQTICRSAAYRVLSRQTATV